MDCWLEITLTHSPKYYSILIIEFEHNFASEEAINESF